MNRGSTLPFLNDMSITPPAQGGYVRISSRYPFKYSQNGRPTFGWHEKEANRKPAILGDHCFSDHPLGLANGSQKKRGNHPLEFGI